MASPDMNNNNSEGTSNWIQELIIDLPKESLVKHCIYKVPHHLLELNAKAYTPKFISIGPIHSKNDEKIRKEDDKRRYFYAFYKRLNNSQVLGLNLYITYLEEEKQIIRDSYSVKLDEPCNDDDNDFVKMILLDSVFIMELFLRNSERKYEPEKYEDDIMFTTSSWICKALQRDLLLLENQIPMSVLVKLHNSVFPFLSSDVYKNENPEPFLKLALIYFKDFYPPQSDIELEGMIKTCKNCNHFTDLIRFTYLPKKIQEKGVNLQHNFFRFPIIAYRISRNATKLNEAGISFEKVEGKSYLDIKLEKIPILSWFLCLGLLPFTEYLQVRLQIPQLKVNQTTECVLRNLIALEQCHYSDQPFVCNYVSFIDSLIHTGEDVELLFEKGAIVHELGSHKELAALVNSLCSNVEMSSNYYGKIIEKLNRHYNNGWLYYMGVLRSVYFRDPWRLSSTIVGVAVFLFALFNFLRLIGVFNP